MKTGRTFILTLLLLIICSLHATAQTEDFYYYSSGKIPLTLNENKIAINIPKENEAITERICKNVQILFKTEHEIRGVTYFDVIALTRSEYERLTSMDFWEEDAKSVILTNFFFTENNAEVMLNPILSVQLKKSEDTGLLATYVERYKIRNLGKIWQYLPLVYTMIVTPESVKSSLDIANEMHESGDFAWATPDFSEWTGPDETQVRGITNATLEKTSRLFDLLGRPVKDAPTHGIYVKDGRKVIR